VIELKILGVGMAAAILIDATLVRGILLPGGARPARRPDLVRPELAPPEAWNDHVSQAGAGTYR
jgi:hypothetical protein